MNNLVTGKVRFSYMAVFEPRKTPNGDEKYSVTLLIPKSDVDTYQRIVNAINQCLQDNLADKFKGVMPANPNLPIYDGDGLRQSGEPFGSECKGHWVISAKSNSAPEIVNINGDPIMSKTEIYSGCYGRASIRFYAYNQNGNKGVGCGLGNIQKLEDGQPLDGRTTAAEDFGTPLQTTQPQPQPQYQMPQYQTTQAIDPITGKPISNIYGVN